MVDYFDPKDKKNKPTVDFFENKSWLLVDTCTSTRMAIRKTISQLGSKSANVFDADNVNDAKNLIITKKPHFVIANKIVKGVNSLILYDHHMQTSPNRINNGYFVITEENSLSEVAWVLEYEMDGIISLPLNGGTMLNTLLNGVERKIKPTDYTKKIEEGRICYTNHEPDKALDLFKVALTLDKTPYEGCAMIGQIYTDKDLIPEAIKSYEEAIGHNKQYFKALKRLSALYYHEKEYKKSYETNLLITKNYPISPESIPDLIRLSIINQKYEDITNYFKIFQTVQSPNLELQRYLAAGMAILGKYFVQNNDTENAIDALKAAYKFSNGKYEVIKSITQSFQELKRADILLELLDKEDLTVWPREIQALYFQTLHLTSKDDQRVITLGESLIKNNIIDIIIYRGIIERSIKMKRKLRTIEHIVLEASKNFPDNANEFEEKLKNCGLN